MTRRERVLKAFNNETVDRTPFGFWFHYIPNELKTYAEDDPTIVDTVVEGHRKFITEFKPELVKMFNDGFFQYPLSNGQHGVKTIEDLDLYEEIGPDHEWIRMQVDLVKKITAIDRDVVYVYNSFSPSHYLKFGLVDSGLSVAEILKSDPERLTRTLEKIGKGCQAMVKAVIAEGGADGIYMSTANPNFDIVSDEEYLKYISPYDKMVLEAANSVSDNNVFHICSGWDNERNNLNLFKDYKAKVFHISCIVEGITIKQAKEIFGDDQAIIGGGFPMGSDSILYNGSKEEIKAFTKEVVEGIKGLKGVILSSDCTMPADISWERLSYVREALDE